MDAAVTACAGDRRAGGEETEFGGGEAEAGEEETEADGDGVLGRPEKRKARIFNDGSAARSYSSTTLARSSSEVTVTNSSKSPAGRGHRRLTGQSPSSGNLANSSAPNRH